MTKTYPILLLTALLLLLPSLAVAMGDHPDRRGYKCYGSPETLKERAEKGDSHSQFCLGELYRYGRNWFPNRVFKKDKKEALKWFRKAVAQGNPFAQYHLGTMIYAGEGIDQNRDEGMKWIRKAADQGNLPARRIIRMLYLAQGDSPHHEQAVKWLIHWDAEFGGISWGNPESVFELTDWLENTFPRKGEALLKDIEQSLSQPAKEGNAESQYLMFSLQNELYPERLDNVPLSKDPRQRVKDYHHFMSQSWLHKSAENGLVDFGFHSQARF